MHFNLVLLLMIIDQAVHGMGWMAWPLGIKKSKRISCGGCGYRADNIWLNFNGQFSVISIYGEEIADIHFSPRETIFGPFVFALVDFGELLSFFTSSSSACTREGLSHPRVVVLWM